MRYGIAPPSRARSVVRLLKVEAPMHRGRTLRERRRKRVGLRHELGEHAVGARRRAEARREGATTHGGAREAAGACAVTMAGRRVDRPAAAAVLRAAAAAVATEHVERDEAVGRGDRGLAARAVA